MILNTTKDYSMKRIVLTLSLFAPVLIAMERPIELIEKNDQVVIHNGLQECDAKKKEVSFDIKKYVNVKKLLLSVANTLFTDEKDDSDSSSNESEDQVEATNDMMRQLINALINALKLEQRVLTIGSSSNGEQGKQVKLKRLCDITKLRRLFTDMNDNYFGKGNENTHYAAQLVDCIKWKFLATSLGEKSDEYIVLKGAADAIRVFSKSDSTSIDITQYLHIQKIVKLLFGFNLEAYADMEALNKLVNSSFKKEQTSLEMCIRCIKPEPFLLLMGCAEEDVEVISSTIQTLCMFAYDLAQDEEATTVKLLEILELYKQYDSLVEEPDSLSLEKTDVKQLQTKQL